MMFRVEQMDKLLLIQKPQGYGLTSNLLQIGYFLKSTYLFKMCLSGLHFVAAHKSFAFILPVVPLLPLK